MTPLISLGIFAVKRMVSTKGKIISCVTVISVRSVLIVVASWIAL